MDDGGNLNQVVANSITVGAWTIVARRTGLLRVGTIAAVLGPTFFGNLFQATSMLPVLLYEFLAGNLIISLLVPRLVPFADVADRKNAARIACQFLAVLLLAYGAAAILTIVAGPLVIGFLTFFVGDSVVRDQQQSAGLILLALIVPQVLLHAVAGVGMAVQQAHGRYKLATAAYSVENIGVMLVVVMSGVLFGTGIVIEEVTTAHLVFLGVGSTLAVALHAAVQWWGASRVGVGLRPRLGWRQSEDTVHLLRLGLPSVGYAAMNALRLILLITVAGGLPGGVVAFRLALTFFALPVAVGARPIAWAMVPHLARLDQQGDRRDFQDNWGKGLSMSMFMVTPAIAGIFALSSPLAFTVAVGEMATPAGVALVTAAILSLAPAILGDTLFIHASHGSYARSDAIGPLTAMALRLALTFAGLVAAVQLTEGRSMLVGLGISMSVGDIVSGGVLSGWVLWRAASITRRIGASMTRAAVAAGLMAVPVYFLGTLLDGDDRIITSLLVVALAAGGAALYLLLQRVVFRADELGLLAAQFKAGIRGRPVVNRGIVENEDAQ